MKKEKRITLIATSSNVAPKFTKAIYTTRKVGLFFASVNEMKKRGYNPSLSDYDITINDEIIKEVRNTFTTNFR